jgi:hypothetical protein
MGAVFIDEYPFNEAYCDLIQDSRIKNNGLLLLPITRYA